MGTSTSVCDVLNLCERVRALQGILVMDVTGKTPKSFIVVDVGITTPGLFYIKAIYNGDTVFINTYHTFENTGSCCFLGEQVQVFLNSGAVVVPPDSPLEAVPDVGQYIEDLKSIINLMKLVT